MSAGALHFSMHWSDWAQLFLQYVMLSLLSFGSVIATAPDMHRFLVQEHGWLSDMQFNTSIAIAQAAPGPNILFVALMGWQLGLNSGGIVAGMLGVVVTMAGILIPSSVCAYLAGDWGHRNRNRRWVRAFKQGMAPVVIALLLSTGWILAAAFSVVDTRWRLWLLTAATALLIWLTRVHLLWLLLAGGVLGWFGLV